MWAPGGFGKVYRAEYEGRAVAVKVVTGEMLSDEMQPLTSFECSQHAR